MPSSAEQELLCNFFPTKLVMAWQHCFFYYSHPSMLYANKVLHRKKKKIEETIKKKKNHPTAPQWKAEKQAAEIVKQPKLWSLKQLTVNENKPHSRYLINC